MSTLPKVFVSAVDESKGVKTVIKDLKIYQENNWAIGLNGDTFMPDGFLGFFTNRSLSFKFYVQNNGVSIGLPTAYDENVSTLEVYMSAFVEAEKNSCTTTIDELKSYQSKNWAIGLDASTLQPDSFDYFFAARSLPFLPYVRMDMVSIGDPTAYDKNIETLEKYIAEM
ncbi:hypothetical protein [Spirosoma fluviale]|uniref:Uncharacterized protein n=1 Tax=Spirosoma fluviale TaxID=1597977 RepID=A0A286F4A9_9BACT|nr:hypothetical protein [Spirosoma fluviale]SOD78003.1 hypothetical protein SAMN06269250_0242 [Spirosoma fluviale]